jgi:hypothetical protein
MDLLRELLSLPISAGATQQSGRPAKAFDAWVAHELRRAGFPSDAVWPRMRRPRVLPEDLAPLESSIEVLRTELSKFESAGERLKPPSLRRAIRGVDGKLPGAKEAYILGDFYSKQVDVAVSSWRRGPDVIISTKTMFSPYRKNLKSRHEEAVGEVSSLRSRHPMATMGYAYHHLAVFPTRPRKRTPTRSLGLRRGSDRLGLSLDPSWRVPGSRGGSRCGTAGRKQRPPRCVHADRILNERPLLRGKGARCRGRY